MQETESQKKQMEQLYSRISTFRILTFILGVAGLAVGISEKKQGLLLGGSLALAAFVFLVIWHDKVEKKEKLLESRFEVCRRYCARFTDEWRSFPENGSAYADAEDCVSSDIDLLGENSLFQMISVCHTEKGKRMLAKRLTNRFVEKEAYAKRKRAIAELGKKPEFAIDFETTAMAADRKKGNLQLDAFEQFCKDESKGRLPGWAQLVRVGFPLIEWIFIVLFLVGRLSYGYALAGFVVLLVFSWLTKSLTGAVIDPVYIAGSVSADMEALIALIGEQQFESTYLQELQQTLSGENGAGKAYHALRPIGQAYNLQYNPLIYQILCGLFLWDYQLAAITARWKRKYGTLVAGCSDRIADLEEWMSFSVLGMVRQTGESEIVYDADAVSLQGTALYHPLLNPENVKENSASLSSGITIITGSNMSGKTTFLRTVAINLVLAYLGAPVCAKQIRASYMKLFTSMRVKDDVAHGISTFYAEILRIKRMANYHKEGQPMICLIDEIFKGTNSADRIFGAKQVITQLADATCMTVVSTHDFELCGITDKEQNPAVNYHFQEYYEDDTLCFDYKIRDGRCTTTNARAILRMAGFEL